MKKLISIVLAALIIASCAVAYTGCSGGSGYKGEINVYNWGDYIAEGSEDFIDTIKVFEEEYNIKVNYTTYETNEEMYNILSTSNSTYDVVFPSEYMVEKLANEGLLTELDYSKIPNADDIMDRFKSLEVDPGNKHCVPYTWNVTGLVYNKTMVDYEPDGWEALWDKNLSGNIVMFGNSRDAYAIAMQLCGIDPSVFTKDDVDKATEKLMEQKPLLKRYAMDQTFLEMENDQAAVAPYYAGDIYNMMLNNENLVGVLPKEGSNLFVDSMCIPASSQNPEGAYEFINFMCRPDISAQNCAYDTYASPIKSAKALMDEDLANSELVYPPDSYLEKCYPLRNVEDDVYAYMQEKFVDVLS